MQRSMRGSATRTLLRDSNRNAECFSPGSLVDGASFASMPAGKPASCAGLRLHSRCPTVHDACSTCQAVWVAPEGFTPRKRTGISPGIVEAPIALSPCNNRIGLRKRDRVHRILPYRMKTVTGYPFSNFKSEQASIGSAKCEK